MAEQRIADEEETREIHDDLSCNCLFYCRYLIPCEHIFQHHLLYGLLTEDKWDQYAHLFEESGFDIYESKEELEADYELAAELSGAAHRKKQIQECMEGMREKYYAMEEEIRRFKLENEEVDIVMEYWINGVVRMTGDIITQSVAQVIQQFPDLRNRVEAFYTNIEIAKASGEASGIQDEGGGVVESDNDSESSE